MRLPLLHHPAPVLLFLAPLLLLPSPTTADLLASVADLPTSQILDRANALLASGSSHDALKLYNLAVERDPASYLTLYRRATLYLSMGQNQRALEDFEKVLGLADDFDQARLQIAKIHLKTGSFSLISPPLDRYLKSHKNDPTAASLRSSASAAQKAANEARKQAKSKQWDGCIGQSSQALELAAHSLELRELRAECYLMKGEVEEAVADLTRASVLSSDSVNLSLRLSLLSSLFLSSPAQQALAPLKQCLHHDPESKPCKYLHRTLRSFDKDLAKTRNFIEAGQFRRAAPILTREPSGGLIKRLEELVREYSETTPGKALGVEQAVLPTLAAVDGEGLTRHSSLLTTLYGWACKAHIASEEIRLGSKYCEKVLKRDPESVDGLTGRGEALLKDENWEEAVRVLNEAFEKGGRQDRGVMEKLQRAQRLLKQSKQKDYYKVLGVARDADVKTIKKGFRKASMKAHPDKGGTEAAMAAVNEAYEVLSNPELRQRFDNGDDPNDTSQQGQNPFAHHGAHQAFQQMFFQQAGGNPFGSGQRVHFQWG